MEDLEKQRDIYIKLRNNILQKHIASPKPHKTFTLEQTIIKKNMHAKIPQLDTLLQKLHTQAIELVLEELIQKIILAHV